MTAAAVAAAAAAAVRVRGFFQTLSAGRRCAVLLILGALAALALPPFHIVPMLIPAACGLLWSLKPGRNWRAGFWAGLALGFGYNTAGLYWISHSFLVDPRFAWMIPFMIFGGCGMMALYTGAAGALTALAPEGPRRVIALAAAWTLTEWVRAWAFTGFPWNMTATVWAFHHAPMQPAAWIGGWGLGFFTMLLAGAPALLAETGFARAAARRVGAALAVICVIWACAAGLRLSAAGEGVQGGAALRIVQANIAQRDKWAPEKRKNHVFDQILLSKEGPAGIDAIDGVDAVIWPETAAPFALNQNAGLRAALGEAAAGAGARVLLTGALKAGAHAPGGQHEDRSENHEPGEDFTVFNSLYALSPDGRIRGHYDKSHLVPFGEYVPFRDVLPIERLAAGRGSFTPGPGPFTMRIDGLPPFSPLICYEVVFPRRAYDPADRPAWLLNITNDAWFGYSTGPFQHFAAARLRAVEESLPVVRAANTGISGVIDAHGRVIKRLGLNERGVIDARLPPALKPAAFAQYGFWAAFAAVAPGFLALWFLAAGRPENRA